MISGISDELRRRCLKVRLFLCDVDGVLTDARVHMGEGVETKSFHIRDGLGLRLLQKEGIRVGWISARPSNATRERAQDLKIDFLHQSQGPKVEAIESILTNTGLTWESVCYMGDDVVDLAALRRAGLSAAPADAIEEVRNLVHYRCLLPGGQGAVRELADLILKTQEKWDGIIKEFSS